MSSPRVTGPLAALLFAIAIASSAAPRDARASLLDADSSWAVPPVKVRGYLQLDYRRAPQGAPIGDSWHEYAIRRARVTVAAQVHPRVTANLTLQGDRPTAGASVGVIDAYADVVLIPALQLRAGQFKYEFDIEGREGDEKNPMIDRSFVTNAAAGSMAGLSTASSPGASFRDRGIELLLTHTQGSATAGIAAGLFQGNGRAADADDQFSWIVRARLQSPGGVTVSMGTIQSPRVSVTPTLVVGDTVLYSTSRRTHSAYTVGADHVWRWNHARAEYYRTAEYSSGLDQQGFYVLDLVRVHRAIELFARWQRLSSNQLSLVFDYHHPSIEAADGGVRVFFMHGERRTDTWIALDYMARNADPFFHPGLTTLNDGQGAALDAAGGVHDVIALRFQVAF